MGLFDYSNQLFDGRFVEEDVLKVLKKFLSSFFHVLRRQARV